MKCSLLASQNIFTRCNFKCAYCILTAQCGTSLILIHERSTIAHAYRIIYLCVYNTGKHKFVDRDDGVHRFYNSKLSLHHAHY